MSDLSAPPAGGGSGQSEGESVGQATWPAQDLLQCQGREQAPQVRVSFVRGEAGGEDATVERTLRVGIGKMAFNFGSSCGTLD